MTKDGLVDENLRTGEQKSATATEKSGQEDSAKETAKKEADEEPIVDEELCILFVGLIKQSKSNMVEKGQP